MANEKIGIDFYATTAAAVAEIDKLSEATKAAADAADAAGKGQKGLGRDIRDTRAAQIEAADALRKVTDAQKLHTLTVQKFGEAGEEATASEARLTRAKEEATRAGTAAAASLEKTAKAVSAAAASEVELSSATKRAAAQLEKMGKDAEKTEQELRKLELQTPKVGYGISAVGIHAGKASGALGKLDTSSYQTSKGFDFMGLASGKLMSVLGPAALVGTVTALVGWLGEAGEKTLQFETQIANLGFSLEGTQAATRGLVSETELAAAASSAMSLKVVKSEAEFTRFAADATKLALKNGVSTGQMISDLTTAVGRGSVEILDNAGIIVKASDVYDTFAASIGKTVTELTEAEKKGALQAAMMEAIRKSADATTVAYDSHAASIARLKIQAVDAWGSMERGAVNFFGAVVEYAQAPATHMEAMLQAELDMQRAMDMTNQEVMRRQGWSQEFKDLAAASGEAAVGMLGLGDVVARFTDPAIIEEGKALLAQEEAKKNILTEEAKQAERIQKAMNKIATDNEAFLQAQTEASLVYGPAPPPKEEKKKKAAKPKKEMTDPGDVARARIFDGASLGNDVSNVAYWTQVEIEQAAAEKSYEIKQLALTQELEILDARGMANEEAQRTREALQDRQLNLERDYSRQQLQMAKTDAQREAGQTRMEAQEYQRRLVNLRRAAAVEAAEQARKVALTEKITGRIGDLGQTMVDAAWQAAEGQRGAGLMALGDYLKTVSKQMAVKALVETALGVSALAGVVTAGLAPGHFAAAGIAAGVAVAAGGAGVGLSLAGEARASSGQGRPEAANDAGPSGSGAANGPGAAGGERQKRELDAQEVPISYAQPGGPMGAQAMQQVINVSFAGATFIGSKGPEEAAQVFQKMLRQGKAAGER